MQTLPNRPEPYEPYDNYAIRLFSKRNKKRTIKNENPNADAWLITFILILLNVIIYGKLFGFLL